MAQKKQSLFQMLYHSDFQTNITFQVNIELVWAVALDKVLFLELGPNLLKSRSCAQLPFANIVLLSNHLLIKILSLSSMGDMNNKIEVGIGASGCP